MPETASLYGLGERTTTTGIKVGTCLRLSQAPNSAGDHKPCTPEPGSPM